MKFAYGLLAISLIVFPWWMLYKLKKQRASLKRHEKEQAYGFQFLILFLFLVITLTVRAIIDFNLINAKVPWLPAVPLAFALLWATYKSAAIFRGVSTWIVLAVLSFFYAYGSIIMINSALDFRSPQKYQAAILDKSSHYDRYTDSQNNMAKHYHYYLTLSSWGPVNKEQVTEVEKSLYQRVQINDSIEVKLYRGTLGIAWYVLAKND